MYQQRTQKGYGLDEVASALQKEIRRGNEREAMFWAMEIVPQFEAYLWQRLVTIVNEDIGIANPMLLHILPTLRQSFFEFREAGKSNARLCLANAVMLLCRSPKSRLADHLQCVVTDERERGLTLPVPDYAQDKHTRIGKSKGRGFAHWLEEGCVLIPTPTLEDPYANEASEVWQAGCKDPAWPKRGVKGGGEPNLFE